VFKVDDVKTQNICTVFVIVQILYDSELTVKWLCFRVSDRVATIEFEVCVLDAFLTRRWIYWHAHLCHLNRCCELNLWPL